MRWLMLVMLTVGCGLGDPPPEEDPVKDPPVVEAVEAAPALTEAEIHEIRVSESGIDAGWRDVPWGSSPSERFSLHKDGGPEKTYTLQDEEMSAGQVPLEAVRYSFWKDQFYSANVFVRGQANCDLLLKALTQKYGPVSPAAALMDATGWASAAVSVSYLGATDGLCMAEFSHRSLSEARRDDLEAASLQAAKDAAGGL